MQSRPRIGSNRSIERTNTEGKNSHSVDQRVSLSLSLLQSFLGVLCVFCWFSLKENRKEKRYGQIVFRRHDARTHAGTHRIGKRTTLNLTTNC